MKAVELPRAGVPTPPDSPQNVPGPGPTPPPGPDEPLLPGPEPEEEPERKPDDEE